MKEISVILKEMENGLTEIRNSFDHREFVTYIEKYKRSYAAGPGKANDADAGYATSKFNLVSDKLLRRYGNGMKEILEGRGKKSDRKMHTEIKNLSDCLIDYARLNMPEWYDLAEKSGKIKDIKTKTQGIMEKV
ncbi:MAG: hypothetical protein HY833_00825 [Candidatus Aenigmarchaeota archaeon]|nr:hypothetical protein [Candidatus Aenigmarchaeota archaeon]